MSLHVLKFASATVTVTVAIVLMASDQIRFSSTWLASADCY